jgi:macrolide transport system ATP-binding/permease protein
MRLIADLRYAFRTLAKSPGFTLIAILSLALGIGANTAMFSFVDAILLRPLPVPDSTRIIEVDSTAPGTRLGSMSYPDYADLRDQTRTVASLVCYDLVPMGVKVSADQVPRLQLGVIASGNFFSGLGVEMPIGRAFRPDEDRVPGRDLVTVISYDLWQREYSSDRSVIGRKIRINGTDFTIVGVAPDGFSGPQAFVVTDVYVPMNAFPQAIPSSHGDYLTSRGGRSLTLLGSLNPGVSAAQAQAELSTISRRLAAQYPSTNRDRSVTALNYLRARFENDTVDATLALMLLAITGLVLLIACANVANLMLARGTARVKEIAIRMAIGAGRTRLVRQLLTESVLLAFLGGAAGLAVGYAGVRFLASIPLPSDFPISLGVRMDMRLLAFSLCTSVATAILFGLVPALRSTRSDLASVIKSSDSGPSKVAFLRGRFTGRNLLITAQLTLSVVLLMLSAFFVRGFQSASGRNPGFRLDHTLFFSLNPNLQRYEEQKSRQFYRQLTDRLRESSGVQSVALSSTIPFNNNQRFRHVIVDGYQPRPGEENPQAFATSVDENYFPLMETPILRGRSFDSHDTATSPRVAIINETLAQRLFPNGDAVGRRMRLDRQDGPEVQVIGVARDGKYLYWAEPPQAGLWTAFAQDFDANMFVEIRTSGDPAAMAAAVRAQVRAMDADMPVFRISTMDAYYRDRAMLGPRVIAQIVSATGVMGLVLAVIGLYGVVAYAVSRRTREIGIRMAIGARPLDVLRMVLGQGVTFTTVGLAIGLAIAIPVLSGGFLKTFVIGVSPYDPSILVGIPAILAAVMIAACWIPARRAARVDPTKALRAE